MLRRFVALPLLLLMSLSLRGDDAPKRPTLTQLAEQLDSPRYIERRNAQDALQKLSVVELAPLRPLVTESPSSEVRSQLRFIFATAEHRELIKAFEKLVVVKSGDEIDYEEALWLVTLLSDPKPSREEMKKELDALAALVRQRLPADVAPAKQSPRKVMDALHAVLYGERKFHINFIDYNNLANASALEVLRKNQGLPITLSMVAICVGRRLQLPIDGVATPGRYLVKYRMKANASYSPDDLFLDPLGEGKVATAEQVMRDFVQTIRVDDDAEKLLATASHRATVQRMLSNVVSALSHLGDGRRIERVEKYMQIVGEDKVEKPPRE